ncbi:ABC transporter substrate-binding protein [Variovorax sp. EL159]|uniref:ABC transporter substrate-binding protein n=1 Tax=Variovorax sp. EL159 TaxID=1566270 RepID=UPI00088C3EF0|nr:ABC transporter substrate-binding protein [Variovorax sp. EL159]SCX72575.1 ABC-type branched-chain amino acid transport system, substrate-binding protein [Variovorax sp. EL159]
MKMLRILAGITAAMFALSPALAQKSDSPSGTKADIVIGVTTPFSGPYSLLGDLARGAQAQFNQINDEGGINGRKVRVIALDDELSPARALELTRQLVEQDKVLFVFGTVGTGSNAATMRYLNTNKVPQLLIQTGATRFVNVKNAPYTMIGMPAWETEGAAFGHYVATSAPNAKVAVLRSNDDFGTDYLAGFKRGLGDKRANLVADVTHEATDPTVDSQIVSLRSSGATVLAVFTNGKFVVQAIRKAAEIGWKPTLILPVGSSSTPGILRPAGVENAVGAISSSFSKNLYDPALAQDPYVKGYYAMLKKQIPNGDPENSLYTGGAIQAQVLAEILRRAGDNLTRENVMKQASSLKDFDFGGLLPGIKINTSPDDLRPFRQLKLMRFDGTSWKQFGDIISD